MRVTAIDIDGNVLDRKTFDRTAQPAGGKAFPVQPPATLPATPASAVAVVIACAAAWFVSGRLVD